MVSRGEVNASSTCRCFRSTEFSEIADSVTCGCKSIEIDQLPSKGTQKLNRRTRDSTASIVVHSHRARLCRCTRPRIETNRELQQAKGSCCRDIRSHTSNETSPIYMQTMLSLRREPRGVMIFSNRLTEPFRSRRTLSPLNVSRNTCSSVDLAARFRKRCFHQRWPSAGSLMNALRVNSTSCRKFEPTASSRIILHIRASLMAGASCLVQAADMHRHVPLENARETKGRLMAGEDLIIP